MNDTDTADLARRAQTFRALHRRTEAVPVPNPWDPGSARLLESLGFECLATTSAGFAHSLGRRDGSVSLEEKLVHCRSLVEATRLPITADLEDGFGAEPEDVAECIRRIGETGVVGGSIEDWTGDPTAPLHEFERAVERIVAAVEAARSLPFDFTLTARTEHLLRGGRDLDEVIRRLRAFQDAGADVLYAPGLTDLDQVRRVRAAIDRPLNVLGSMIPDADLQDFTRAGATRVSLGSGLQLQAYAALERAGRSFLATGRTEGG